jgi:hypothetical protein
VFTHVCFVALDSYSLGSTVIPTPIDCRVTIDLCERRFGRSGRILASCTLDLSSAAEKGEPAHVYAKRGRRSRTIFISAEICLDLKGGANKLGELTICVASSLASASDAVESANRAAPQLGPGPAVVSDAVQATAPLTAEITAQFNAWQPLLSRLGALVKVADTVAEARFILKYLSPATNNKYLQTGSSLDQVGMGCRLSRI